MKCYYIHIMMEMEMGTETGSISLIKNNITEQLSALSFFTFYFNVDDDQQYNPI